MGEFRRGAGCALAGIAGLVMAILGAVLHVWTVVIAFLASGLVGAVITVVLPVLAQIFWFIAVWRGTGTLWNTYCVAVLCYVGLFVVAGVGAILYGPED